MIDAFLDTWPLFRESHLAAWLVALLLGAVGVFVVVRDQLFVGAAVAQCSMLGIALGLCVGSAWGGEGTFWTSDPFLSAVAVVDRWWVAHGTTVPLTCSARGRANAVSRVRPRSRPGGRAGGCGGSRPRGAVAGPRRSPG